MVRTSGSKYNVRTCSYSYIIGYFRIRICKSKNNLVAEYSLKDISKPIGVSEYKVTSNLTGELEKQLPSVEDIQNRIK